MKKFPRKRILITGAGSGIGRAIALEFAVREWKVCVAEINKNRAAETVKMVNSAGGQGLMVVCDVSKYKDIEKTAKILKKEWGGIDILVNNAGVVAAGYIEKIPLDKWKWIIDINLMSVIYGCKIFVPMLEEQGGGHIVNIASMAGIATLPEMVSYNVTKAGVIALSETLVKELAGRNIGVTLAAPTFIKTNLMDQLYVTDARQKILTEKFFSRAGYTSEKLARLIYKAVEKKRLYVVPQLDAKFIWLMKRLFPERTAKVMARIYVHGLMEKYYLGISDEEARRK